jgi:hypothetical protein
MLKTLVTGLCLLLALDTLSAETPPSRPHLKSGTLEFRMLHSTSGPPYADATIMLLPACPEGRSILSRTDQGGNATLKAETGNYLLSFNDAALGVIEVSPRGTLSSVHVIVPPDYPVPQTCRPDLRKEQADGQWILFAGQTPVDIPTAPEERAPASVRDMSLDDLLKHGLIREGLQRYANPSSDAERFSLALLQTLDGAQAFCAGMNRFSYRNDLHRMLPALPFLRLIRPGAAGMSSEQATPEKIALLFRNLRTTLRLANGTLRTAGEEGFKVEVTLSQIRLDFDGNGIVAPHETIVQTIGPLFNLPDTNAQENDIVVRFDSADAKWLEGYTHLIAGMLEIILSYDWRPAWDHGAHLLLNVYHPEPPIVTVSDPTANDRQPVAIADLIAMLHALNLEVIDPDGLRRARREFEGMVACSRASWESILAETDDDLEWIPSPAQAGPGGARIRQEALAGWMQVLDELEDVLAGNKLLPHWRMLPDRGIHLVRLTENPPRFDPVMLIQGSALVPYVEIGTVSNRARWEHLTAPFGGSFSRFVLWVN